MKTPLLLLLPALASPALFLAAVLGPVLAHSADLYPARPVRIVVPTGAGGITDILGRIIAQKLSQSMAQQCVIDNRPGASGILGSQIVAGAAPDGYTLLMVFPSHVVNMNLFANVPYDTVKAFAPITLVSTVSQTLAVNAEVPAKNIAELIALAREKRGLNYGSVGRGSLGHLSSELLRSMTGMNLTHVAYKGGPQIISAIISGEVQMYNVASVASALPHAKSGRVRLLGVSTRKRLAVLPDVPTIAETVPGYEAVGWNGMLAPAGTPKAIIARLHGEIARVVRSSEFAAQLVNEGAVSVGNTPAEFAAVIEADINKWARVIREAGIRRE